MDTEISIFEEVILYFRHISISYLCNHFTPEYPQFKCLRTLFLFFSETIQLFRIMCCRRLYRITFSRVRFLHLQSPDIGGSIKNQENLAQTKETMIENNTRSQIEEHKKYEVDGKRRFSCVVMTTQKKKSKMARRPFNTPTHISVTHLQMYSRTNGQLFRSISF